MSAVIQEPGRYGSGQTVRRIEDPALVAGRGQFTDDMALPGQTHMVFLRSPYAHARILSIDVSAAKAIAGVVAVFTGADLVTAGVKPMSQPLPFPRPDGKPGATAMRRVLAHELVRYVGEAVAAVVAETRIAAINAAEALVVDYEELPCVVDAVQAMSGSAPALCPEAPDNIACAMRHGDAAAVDQAFAKAKYKVAVDIVNQRLAPSPMEPRVVLAYPEAGTERIVVQLSSQMPTAVRDGVAGALGMDSGQIRVRVADVGGGFGMKTGCYPEDVMAAYAARTLKRPVKWNSQRLEEFQASTHGRDIVSHAEMALDTNGKVLGMRVRSVANVGAYASVTGVIIQLLVGPWVTTSVYDIQAIALDLTAVMTNTMPLGAYRGAGRPEAIYTMERLMDAAAREMKLDPSELRRRNLIRPEQMPYKNPMQQVYDVGQFE
jgi:carbon-monoxide dehydrogenase large subunit